MIENFSSEFLAFCKSKPADEYYDSTDRTMCALGQFATSCGAEPDLHHCTIGATRYDYPPEIYREIHKAATFGAIAERLEAAGVK